MEKFRVFFEHAQFDWVHKLQFGAMVFIAEVFKFTELSGISTEQGF